MGLAWYLSWAVGILLAVLLVAAAWGFDPDNLHVHIGVVIEFIEGGDNHDLIPIEDRPVITAIEGVAAINVAPVGRWGRARG